MIEWRPSTILPIFPMLFVCTAQLTSLLVNVTKTTYLSVRNVKTSLKLPRNPRNNVCVQHTIGVYCIVCYVLGCTAVCGLYVYKTLSDYFVVCISFTTSVIIDSRVTGIGNSINTSFVFVLFHIVLMVKHPG